MNSIRKVAKSVAKKIASSKLRVIIITIVAIFCAATIYAAAANSYTVEINLGRGVRKITTMKTDPYEILEYANISTTDEDIIDISDFTAGADSSITIYKSCQVTIVDEENGNSSTVTAIGTVKKVLDDNGIVLGDDDGVNCDLEGAVYDGMEINVTRAFPVTISADGEIYRINIAGGTVSDALDKAVVTVDDDDILSKPLDTPLAKGMSIKVTKISYVEREDTTIVPFETVKNNTNTLSKGDTKVSQKGVDGEKVTTYKEKYVNGKLTESVLQGTKVTKKAVNEVILVGTKNSASKTTTLKVSEGKVTAVTKGSKLARNVKTISTITAPSSVVLDSNGVPTSYKKKIVGTASAYSGGGITSTGRAAQNGYIAVNPNQISYHTKMWIVSNDGRYVYGYASAEDTGGFTKWTGSRSTLCDLYMSDESMMYNFGRRTVTIYVL